MQELTFKYSTNIAINVRDLHSALEFYQKTLGLGLVSLNRADDCGAEMTAGPLTLWIDGCQPKEDEHVGKVFFEFETNNLELARKSLVEKGVSINRETEGRDFKGIMALDPYGMRFHVYAKTT